MTHGRLPDFGGLSKQGRDRGYNAVARTRTRLHTPTPGARTPESSAASERIRDLVSSLGVWCSADVDTGPLASVHQMAYYHARKFGVTVTVTHLGPARWRLTRTD